MTPTTRRGRKETTTEASPEAERLATVTRLVRDAVDNPTPSPSSTDRDETAAPDRVTLSFACEHGHTFDLTFSSEAELPAQWDCPHCGKMADRTDGTPHPDEAPAKPVRNAWDRLRERRSIDDLDALLSERIEEMRVAA
ncbi:MAG: RNA polymerase-binding protein RbpA [Propionibacteriaceae bacterium]|jgi:hypothetical protein|nr:RNA polymerase-binding protein RbpA [Propionibacteriaceae bacterium]